MTNNCQRSIRVLVLSSRKRQQKKRLSELPPSHAALKKRKKHYKTSLSLAHSIIDTGAWGKSRETNYREKSTAVVGNWKCFPFTFARCAKSRKATCKWCLRRNNLTLEHESDKNGTTIYWNCQLFWQKDLKIYPAAI